LAKANFSLSLQQLLFVILAVSLLTLVLAGMLASQGFWPILLIAVIQTVLVALTLYRAWREAWAQELIESDGETILISRKTASSSLSIRLDARWARVMIDQTRGRWYAPQISLYSLGEEIKLGRFLATGERIELANQLRRLLSRGSAWTKPARAND